MFDSLARAAQRLQSATSVVVFTGAGISAESGLPTFRSGFNAMWKQADIQRYANPRGYRAHAPDSWRWYQMRHGMAGEAQPNAGHHAIVEIEKRVPQFTLVTQNVDGLHHRAGSRNLLELHGNLREVRCFDCGRHAPWPAETAGPDCRHCNGLLRPNVVFFEEQLPEDTLEQARDAAETCDVLISVGTSNLVWPAAELPAFALDSGASVIIVNPDMTGQPSSGPQCVHLVGAAGEVLPKLIAAAWGHA
jgi:NAD-dependent deacetylase